MVFEPNTEDEIKDSLESRLQSKVTKLTNFVATSFNNLFIEAFAESLRDYEVRLLAAQLSGWVDYAGGPIDQSDLDQLGIPDFDNLDLLNEYMLDSHLDNLGALVGVTRSPGEQATGEVEITVFDQDTRVPDGLRVATPPDVDGDVLVFEVDIDEDFVTPADQGNSTTVTVDVIAEDFGDEYNVGSGRISRFRSPPPGLESVNNPAAVDGGEDEETNDEFRARVKDAIFQTSGGGTVEGIKGYIISNVDGVNDVFLDEFKNATPIYVDVIVDGGTDTDVSDAIEDSRPAGVRHNLVRPATYSLGIQIELRGTDITNADVKTEIEDYIFDLDLGDAFIRDKMIQQVLNIEPDIENVLATNVRITEVTNWQAEYSSGTTTYSLPVDELGYLPDEQHLYESETDVYRLATEPVDSSSVTITATVNGAEQTVSASEYSVVDDDGDGMFDSIDWTTGSTTPDDDTVWSIEYDTLNSASETFTYDGSSAYELTYLPALAGDSSVSDNSGDTYTLGTDYDIVDTDNDGVKDSIEWLSGGSTPDNPEDFTVTYEIDVGSIRDVNGTLSGTEDYDFVEGIDFDELDDDSDGHFDSIDWSLGGDVPDDGTDFTVDLSAESGVMEDFFITNRDKIEPEVDQIEVITYD